MIHFWLQCHSSRGRSSDPLPVLVNLLLKTSSERRLVAGSVLLLLRIYSQIIQTGSLRLLAVPDVFEPPGAQRNDMTPIAPHLADGELSLVGISIARPQRCQTLTFHSLRGRTTAQLQHRGHDVQRAHL